MLCSHKIENAIQVRYRPETVLYNMGAFLCRHVCKIAQRRLLVSPCTSVRPPAWNNSASTGRIFMKFDIWVFFSKSFEKIQVSLKSDKNNGQFTWRPVYIYDCLVEWEMFRTTKSEHILCSTASFHRKSCRLWDNVEKYCGAGQTTWQYNPAHAHCTLDNWCYTHTPRICNSYCSSQ